MADLSTVELGVAETTVMPLEVAEEPAAVATRSEEEQTMSRDSCVDSGDELACQVEATTVEDAPNEATTPDAAPQHAESTPESQKNREDSAEPKAEEQTVPRDSCSDSRQKLNGQVEAIPVEEVPAAATTADAERRPAETTPESQNNLEAQAEPKATDDVPHNCKELTEDTLDEDGSEAGDSTGVGCNTASDYTSCTGQTEEDITVRDDAVMQDVTTAQAQAASLLAEIASLDTHSADAPEPEELRVLLSRLGEAHAGLEQALEDLQADSLAIMESNAELHTAIATTLRDLTQTRSGSAKTPREFAVSPEALLENAKKYWQQVKAGRLNVQTADQKGQSEQATSEHTERPEWVARSQELGRQLRDQLKTLTSKVPVAAGPEPQQQLGKQLAEQKQKLQEQLREHWSALSTRTPAETGKQVVEKSREIKKQLSEQLKPAHVQQATLQLQSQVLEGYQNLSTRVSQDISEAISKLPWKQEGSATVAQSQTSIAEQASGIFSACDEMEDDNSASSAATALKVDGLNTETTAPSAGQVRVDETNQLPFMDAFRNHITRGWTLPGKPGWGAAGEAKSVSTSRNNNEKRKCRKSDEEAFTRVLVELQLQLEEGKVAMANLRTSDSRSRVASKLIHEHKLAPAVKPPLKAILKKAVANAEQYPVQVSVTYAELLHTEEGA